MHATPTGDIKLASILVALGAPMRSEDPVTCVVENRNGKDFKQFTFWFDTSLPEHQRLIRDTIKAYDAARDWKNLILDKDHPLYWMKGVLENRERLLGWIRDEVQPMKILNVGTKTVLIGANAPKQFKEQIKRRL